MSSLPNGTNSPTEKDLLTPFERQAYRGSKIRDVVLTERKNFAFSVQSMRGIWRLFLELDEIWMRGIDDMQRATKVDQALALLLFIHGHSQFRSAFPIAFSARFTEAWNILRTGVEMVAHAYKIHREPSLSVTWLRKNDGESQRRDFQRLFEQGKKQTLFSQTRALQRLYEYWKQYSDWGTHSSVSSLGRKVERRDTIEDVDFRVHYFETDPGRIAVQLFTLLLTSRLMETVFHDAFEQRLQFDIDLEKRRHEFAKDVEGIRRATAREFSIQPPLIWPGT